MKNSLINCFRIKNGVKKSCRYCISVLYFFSSLSRELALRRNDTLRKASSVTVPEVRIELVQSWLALRHEPAQDSVGFWSSASVLVLLLSVLFGFVCLIYTYKHITVSQRQFRQCPSPCPRFIPKGDTHSLFVMCLGVTHKWHSRMLSMQTVSCCCSEPCLTSGRDPVIFDHGERRWSWWRMLRRIRLFLSFQKPASMFSFRVRKPVLQLLLP